MTLLCSRQKLIHPMEYVSLLVDIGHNESVQRLLLLWMKGLNTHKAFATPSHPAPISPVGIAF